MINEVYQHEMEARNRKEDFRLMMMAQSSIVPMTGLSPAYPFAASALFDEVAKLNLGQRAKKMYSWFIGLTFSDNYLSGKDREITSQLAERFGVTLPLDDQDSKALIEEARRFQWIEAERAGRDIWTEKDPKDPDGVAFREWFARHYGEWYLNRFRSDKAAA